VSPHKFKRGGELPTLATPPRVGPKTLANPKPTGVGKRGWRGRSPWQGVVGGCPPHETLKGGRLSTSVTPRHEWDPKLWRTQSPRGWGKGVQGASPRGKGLWGVSPHKFKRGGELPTLATPPRVGPKTLANPKPTGVGKTGVQGVEPPGRGSWGVSPHKFKRGGELPTLAPPTRVGPKTLANPKLTRVGNWQVCRS